MADIKASFRASAEQVKKEALAPPPPLVADTPSVVLAPSDTLASLGRSGLVLES